MEAEEERRKFRNVGCVEGPLKASSVQCDFYAEFMRRSGMNNSKEWARRFDKDIEFHKSDRDNRQILLDIMLEGPGGGTGSHIDETDAKKWCHKHNWCKSE